MRYSRALAIGLLASLLWFAALPFLRAQSPKFPARTEPTSALVRPVTAEQVCEHLKITQFGEMWRTGWLRAMEANKSKGSPYWPESFWSDLRKHMETVDLVPMVTELYRTHVSFEDMQHANSDLHKMSIQEFAGTPFGAHFCQETQLSGPENEAATLALTQAVFQQVYEAHKTEIKASRVKYLADHPDYVDDPSR